VVTDVVMILKETTDAVTDVEKILSLAEKLLYVMV
jgi:hypothetical protein